MILDEPSHQKNTPHDPDEVGFTAASHIPERKKTTTFQTSERKVTLLSDPIHLSLTQVWHSAGDTEDPLL